MLSGIISSFEILMERARKLNGIPGLVDSLQVDGHRTAGLCGGRDPARCLFRHHRDGGPGANRKLRHPELLLGRPHPGESAAWEGGRLLPGTGYDKVLYHVTDHLGSVRVVKDGTGAVLQRFDYYPFGSVSGSWSSSTNPSQPTLRHRFSGKEIAGQIVDASLVASALAGTPAAAAGTPYLDFGARLYDPRTAAWLSQDPMAEKYYPISPYAYCAGNPVNSIDKMGKEIRGVTKRDAEKFREDIYLVLADDKFAKVREHITIKGKAFKPIDMDKLNNIMNDIELTSDENNYITLITNAINSKDIHQVEYLSGEHISPNGAKAFVNHMNKTLGDGIGDKMRTLDGRISSKWVQHSGGGLNVPTKRGSHSFISDGLISSLRAVTSGHEVFGHGIPAAKKLTPSENNENAIQTDNLIRRLLGLEQRDGSNHGGYNEGHITNPYGLPILR